MHTKRVAAGLMALAASLLTQPAGASSHREALAILNEPCADNTDTYAWVSDGDHAKLYLVSSFLPLHEPGQGNQGLRACDGYRYEFHVAKGTKLDDEVVYRVQFKVGAPTDGPPAADDPPLGGNELLWQITGGTETYTVTRLEKHKKQVIGRDIPVTPNNHGPQTDRLAYGLGPFAGYDSGDPTSREVGLYDDAFTDGFIRPLDNGGRIWAGQRDDGYQLDEKGIFDLVNLCRDGLFGIAGARSTPCEDVFTGFNLFSIALEVPTTDLFPDGIPHNGQLIGDSTDSLLRVWVSISRPKNAIVDPKNVATGIRYSGPYVQVGRNALPLFNAGLVGTARQTLYLRSRPDRDVTRFGGDILFPVLARDAELLGIYGALGIDPNAAGLKGPRTDIVNAINLGRPIPIEDGFTGDVITLDAATDSSFPNGRSLKSRPEDRNRLVDDVSDIIISLVVAGNPAAGAGDGVGRNDKPYRTVFPFLALPHQGLNEGHGGTNQD